MRPLPGDYWVTDPGVVVVAVGVAAGDAVSVAGVAAVGAVVDVSGIALGAVGATGGIGGIMNGGKLLFMPGCIPNGAIGRA